MELRIPPRHTARVDNAAHRRSPGRVRGAARAGGREPVQRSARTGARPSDPRRRRAGRGPRALGAGAGAARDRAGNRGAAARARRDGRRSPSSPSSSASSRPGSIGLGRYLGLTAKRTIEIARALDVRTPERVARGRGGRPAARGARHRAEDRGAAARALARERASRAAPRAPAPARPRAGRRHRGGARRRDGRRPAALARRVRAPRGRLCRATTRGRCWRGSPRCRRSSRCIEQAERRAVGVTVEGVPVELDRRRRRSGSAPRSCAPPGAAPTSPRSSRCPDAPDEEAVYPRSACLVPPELREAPFRGEPPALVELERDPRRPALPHDLVGRAGERRGDGPRGPRARLRVPGDLRSHAGRRRRPGPRRPTTPPPGARRSPRRTRSSRRSASCAASSATSCPTAGSTSPTTSSPSSTGCRPAARRPADAAAAR